MKIKNNVTELVFILDRSGSMAGLEEDVIGGFNATLARQREKEGKVYVSTVLFDNACTVLHDRADLTAVAPMMREDYRVGGCTALLDAVGGAIHHIGNVHKYARPEDVPEHTIFVITTDGMENASHRYTRAEIRAKIERQTQKHGWEFLFLAANIDAADTAEGIGIRRERAARYEATHEGVVSCCRMVCDSISALREGEDEEDVDKALAQILKQKKGKKKNGKKR